MKNYFTEEKPKLTIETWESRGYLKELTNNQKQNVGISFEVAYLIFSNEISNRFSDTIQKLTFPILQRIIQSSEELIHIDILVEETIDIIEKLNKEINKQNKPWTVKRLTTVLLAGADVEALFVSAFCGKYKFNKSGTYDIRIV